MRTSEIIDPAQAERLKGEIKHTELVFGPKAVTIGVHPDLGHVVLIETDEGALLVRDDAAQ